MIALIAVLSASLLFGGLAHSVVPHGHGSHHHSQATEAAWDALHDSLRHEDKKALGLAAFIQALLALSAVVAFGLMRRAAYPGLSLAVERTSILSAHPLRAALRRGIEAHRAFP